MDREDVLEAKIVSGLQLVEKLLLGRHIFPDALNDKVGGRARLRLPKT